MPPLPVDPSSWQPLSVATLPSSSLTFGPLLWQMEVEVAVAVLPTPFTHRPSLRVHVGQCHVLIQIVVPLRQVGGWGGGGAAHTIRAQAIPARAHWQTSCASYLPIIVADGGGGGGGGAAHPIHAQPHPCAWTHPTRPFRLSFHCGKLLDGAVAVLPTPFTHRPPLCAVRTQALALFMAPVFMAPVP